MTLGGTHGGILAEDLLPPGLGNRTKRGFPHFHSDGGSGLLTATRPNPTKTRGVLTDSCSELKKESPMIPGLKVGCRSPCESQADHEDGPLHYLAVGSKWAVWSIVSRAECSSIAKHSRLSAKRAQQMADSLMRSTSEPGWSGLSI